MHLVIGLPLTIHSIYTVLWASAFKVIMLFSLASLTNNVNAQCTWNTITVTDGVGAPDVIRELIDGMGDERTRGKVPGRTWLIRSS